MASALAVAGYGGEALGPYWLVAAPAGGIATGIVAVRRERRVGVERPGWPYVAVAVSILAGASLAGWAGEALGARAVSAAGPSLVVALGYLLFARLERSRTLTWTAAGLAALAVVLPATGIEPDPVATALAVVFGAVFLATGLVLRGRRA